MPRDLAALLVEEGAVPADVVERALARQRELGGTLDTALLELGAMPEAQLAGWLSRAAELPQAPDSAWAAADPRARRVFPSRVAERHGLAPFALEGRELALVATYPVDLGLLDEISFMLSLHLTPHVGPEWRVRELIHRIYGGALPPRLAALSGGPPAEVEPAAEPPPAPAEEPPAPRAPPPTTAAAAAGFAPGGQEQLEPLAAALAQALESVEVTVDEGGDAGEPPAPAAPPQAAAAQEPPAEEPEDELEEELPPEEPPTALDRSAPPRWTLDEARAALGAARHRDEVVLVALRYARDFFEFAAMFAVTRDAVAGHDALGVEEGRDRARSVAIWASDPGIFRTVIEMQSPYLGPVVPGAAGTDAVLHGLARTPRTVLVYPVLLRERAVCVLYADNGEAPVSARRLGDLLLFLSTVGTAFERMIRDRKARRRKKRASPKVAVETPPEVAIPPAVEPSAPPAVEAQAPAPTPPVDELLRMGEEVEREPSFLAPPAEVDAPAAHASPAKSPAPMDAEPPAPQEPAAAEPEPALAAPAEEAPADETGAIGSPTPVEAAALAPSVAPGRTSILWPAARGPAEPAAAAPAAPAQPVASDAADSLAALEEQFFARGDDGTAEQPAPAEPEQILRPMPVAVPEPILLHGLPTAVPVAPGVAKAERAAPPAPPAPAEAAAPEPPRRTPPPVAAPPAASTVGALADRALDADPAVSDAARAALGNVRRDPAARQASEKLRRALLSGMAARATRAAHALGALRDVDAIPLLIQALETDPETAGAAGDALGSITLQRHGTDARRWLAWWKENRGRGRADWLFSALTHADRDTRVAASLELSQAAPPPVVYTADMPVTDRERAARAWAGWWARSGHVL
jgi:hypothetical protein